jgi:exodeoxyribonuclease V alpha subunit
MSIEVTAMLSRIIFESQQRDFMVAEFIDCSSARRFRASGEPFRTGKDQGQQRYRLFGEWKATPKYGETFHIGFCEPLKPQSLTGLATFLSNNVKGVGEKTSQKFVEQMAFTSMEQLLDVCKNEPQKIYSFFGTRRSIADDVILCLTGDDNYRQVMMFLHENQIPAQFAKKIYERYGSEARDLLTENPYRLIKDFRNVGFRRADAIAQKLGVSPSSRFRLEACALYTLERAQDDGHCCLPRDVLVNKTCENMSQDQSFSFAWVLSELREIFREQLESKDGPSFCIRKNNASIGVSGGAKADAVFYLPETLEMESRAAYLCAERIARSEIGRRATDGLLTHDTSRDALEQKIPAVPWRSLSEEQFQAVVTSASTRFMILTGGPGCGKTFVLQAIYQLQRHLRRNVALCAPTGLAAKRMTQSIGAQAFTLHKLLGLGRISKASGQESDQDSYVGEGSIELADTVICDESSMLSLDLFLALLESTRTDQTLILVGDVDQLPSVGPGQCLKDLIHSEKVPVCSLTKIFRQKGSSPIPHAARRIISGEMPDFDCVLASHLLPEKRDLVRLHCKPDQFFDELIPFLQSTVPAVYGLNPVTDVQILVPMRKSAVGQDEINRRLQEVLNPPAESKNEIAVRAASYVLREGDKVIQTRNNYEKEVFNGDLGRIKVVRKIDGRIEVDVLFQDRIVRLEDEESDDLQLCYAMTIHKSQGSEFPLCIIPMFSAYYNMLYRNLLYTAVTRASQTVLIIGEDWALKRAVRNAEASQRHTSLEAIIEEKLIASELPKSRPGGNAAAESCVNN